MARYGDAPWFIPERRHRRGWGTEWTSRERAGYGMGYRRPGGRGGYGEYGSDYEEDIGEYRPMGAVGPDLERMGMHDFNERYGRYSGGSPYSYEYSERTVVQPSRFPAVRGFSRRFGRSRSGRRR